MANPVGNLLRSFGLKRYIASVLTILAGILGSNPHTVYLVPVIQKLAAALGLAGLVHAGKAGSLGDHKALSLQALFSLLVAASSQVPALLPYQPIISLIGSLLGLSAVATSSVPALKKKK